jgi:hypothetical protein
MVLCRDSSSLNSASPDFRNEIPLMCPSRDFKFLLERNAWQLEHLFFLFEHFSFSNRFHVGKAWNVSLRQ